MSKALPFAANELRSSLMEVLDACPVDHCNPTDCPLYPLRKWSRRVREGWFNALTVADLEYLASYHRVCTGLKVDVHCRTSVSVDPPPASF